MTRNIEIIFKGIVDKDRNPFSIPSWCREGNPEGSGRVMTKKRKIQFKKVLSEGGLLENIKEPNFEKYPSFQAVRWEYAVKKGDKLIPTQKWIDTTI